MNKILYLLIDKKDLTKKFDKKVDLFTLNEFVLSDFEKKNYNHLFPKPKETSKLSKLLIHKIKETKIEIYRKIKNLYIFNQVVDLDELLEPFLEAKISRFYYLKNSIPNYDKYIILGNRKNNVFYSKIDLILAIDKTYTIDNTKNKDCNDKFLKFDFNFYNKWLLKLQTLFIKKSLNSQSKEISFLSAQESYFIKILKNKIKSQNKIILYYDSSNSYLKIILLILNQIYKSIFNNGITEIGIFLLAENKINHNHQEINKNINNFEINDLKKNYSSYLIKQLYCYVQNYLSYKKYLLKFFKIIETKKSYFHTTRYPDLFAFSRALTNLNKNVNLISHGSHTVQNKDSAGEIASQSMASGMTYTKLRKIKILSQSFYCDDFLDSLNSSYQRIDRLLEPNLLYKNNSKLIKENSKIKILFIGTVKKLGSRRYYFESSSEFFASIKIIYDKLIIYKDIFEISLRIRDVKNELNKEILNNALRNKKDLINISIFDSIYLEIKNSDCIISYSSTLLEESLIMNKPVMCFGMPEYNHLKHYENNKMIKSKNPIDKNLKLIEDALGKNFIYPSKRERITNNKF